MCSVSWFLCPALYGRGIKWCVSDVCLSCTLGLSREQSQWVGGPPAHWQLAGAVAYCDDLPHNLFWLSCRYWLIDWLEKLLCGCFFVTRQLSPRSPGWRVHMTLFSVLFYCVFVLFPGHTQYIWYSVARYSLFVLKVPTNQIMRLDSIVGGFMLQVSTFQYIHGYPLSILHCQLSDDWDNNGR